MTWLSLNPQRGNERRRRAEILLVFRFALIFRETGESASLDANRYSADARCFHSNPLRTGTGYGRESLSRSSCTSSGFVPALSRRTSDANLSSRRHRAQLRPSRSPVELSGRERSSRCVWDSYRGVCTSAYWAPGTHLVPNLTPCPCAGGSRGRCESRCRVTGPGVTSI